MLATAFSHAKIIAIGSDYHTATCADFETFSLCSDQWKIWSAVCTEENRKRIQFIEVFVENRFRCENGLFLEKNWTNYRKFLVLISLCLV